jgi:hypothetical protein
VVTLDAGRWRTHYARTNNFYPSIICPLYIFKWSDMAKSLPSPGPVLDKL